MYPRLTLNILTSCFYLPSAENAGMHANPRLITLAFSSDCCWLLFDFEGIHSKYFVGIKNSERKREKKRIPFISYTCINWAPLCSLPVSSCALLHLANMFISTPWAFETVFSYSIDLEIYMNNTWSPQVPLLNTIQLSDFLPLCSWLPGNIKTSASYFSLLKPDHNWG